MALDASHFDGMYCKGAALAGLGRYAPDFTVLPTGPLADQLSAYLPPSLHDEEG